MSGQIVWKPGQFLVRQYTGSSLKIADRIADCDIWRGPIELCLARALLRGTMGWGDRLGWVCTSSEVTWEKLGIGTLKINWEVGGLDADIRYLPLDDWRIETVELYPKVERHKALRGPAYPGNQNDIIAPETITLAYRAVHGSTTQQCADARKDLNSLTKPLDYTLPSGTTWEDQSLWGWILMTWLSHGHENYYLAGIKYSYIRHSFTWLEPVIGGIIETPPWGPLAGNTDLNWLRLADAPESVGVNGSVIKMTSTWLGGPDGHWDPILYA